MKISADLILSEKINGTRMQHSTFKPVESSAFPQQKMLTNILMTPSLYPDSQTLIPTAFND